MAHKTVWAELKKYAGTVSFITIINNTHLLMWLLQQALLGVITFHIWILFKYKK